MGVGGTFKGALTWAFNAVADAIKPIVAAIMAPINMVKDGVGWIMDKVGMSTEEVAAPYRKAVEALPVNVAGRADMGRLRRPSGTHGQDLRAVAEYRARQQGYKHDGSDVPMIFGNGNSPFGGAGGGNQLPQEVELKGNIGIKVDAEGRVKDVRSEWNHPDVSAGPSMVVP